MWSEPFSEDAIVAKAVVTTIEAAVTRVDDDVVLSFRALVDSGRLCRPNLDRHRH